MTEGSAIANLFAKGQETVRASEVLAEFTLSLPPIPPLPSIPANAVIAIDAESGLLAINCTSTSGDYPPQPQPKSLFNPHAI